MIAVYRANEQLWTITAKINLHLVTELSQAIYSKLMRSVFCYLDFTMTTTIF